LLPYIAPAAASALFAFAGGAWLLNRLDAGAGSPPEPRALHSPLDLPDVARFALFLSAVIVIGRLVADGFGQAGLLPFAAAAGLADVDAVAMAVGSLVRGSLSESAGANAVLVAILVNTFSKGAIAAVTGGWRYAGLYLAVAACAATIGAAVWFFAAPSLSHMFS
jgi:uncharacterized membrane protein (DUF4010 family)